jgi:hypothetical protein
MKNEEKKQNILANVSRAIPQYCDKCGHKHSYSDLHIIDHTDSKVVCRLNCANCRNVYILHIHKGRDGEISASRAQIKPEFRNEEEVKKFEKLDVIKPDEVLDVYVLLEQIKTAKEFISLLDY